MAETSRAASPWAGRDRATERERKREAVLNAAAEAFAENGYHQTSLDEIAGRLGVSKPTLYYYARNKDELIVAASSRAVDQVLQATRTDPDALALAQLQNMLRRYAEIMSTDLGRCIDVLRHAGVAGDAGAKVLDGLRAIDARIRELLRLGVADGSIAPCDDRLTAFALAGAINGIADWFKADGALSAEVVAAAIVNQLTHGIAPR